jgi:hypothetical protein
MRSKSYLAVPPVLAGILSLWTPVASAQSLELPAPSPHARVEQRVGLTDFTVDYSSPGVKGRKIWGELVPLDKPWRTGANAATKLIASKDFMLAGKPVKAGTYALYTIPGKTSWTVILNSSSENWGTNGYDQTKDVARATVKPEAIPSRERMTFIFTNSTDDATRLDLEWEKVRVSIPLTVDTKTVVAANMQKAVDETWRPTFQSARYLLDSNGDLDQALTWIDASIATKPTWWNNWVKAQILAKKGKSADAVASATKAQELGKDDKTFQEFFKADVDKAIGNWKKKS